MTTFTELGEKNLKIHIETQKSPNTQSNFEIKQHKAEKHHIRFQDIIQGYCKPKQDGNRIKTDTQNRTEPRN